MTTNDRLRHALNLQPMTIRELSRCLAMSPVTVAQGLQAIRAPVVEMRHTKGRPAGVYGARP
jgi:DNA-binding transcriptional regulator GbsR (MarR family)